MSEKVMIYQFMNERLKAFMQKTEGAVTVEFVVLMGVAVFIATFTYLAMADKVVDLLASFNIL